MTDTKNVPSQYLYDARKGVNAALAVTDALRKSAGINDIDGVYDAIDTVLSSVDENLRRAISGEGENDGK